MKKINQSKLMLIVTIVISIIAIGFLVMTSVNTISMNKNIQTLTEHPFAVSYSLNKIRNSMENSISSVERLAFALNDDNAKLADTSIDHFNRSLLIDAQVVLDRYLGPTAQANELHSTLQTLHTSERELLRQLHEYSSEEIRAYVNTDLIPLRDKANSEIDSMFSFISNTVARLSHESEVTAARTSGSTLLASCLIAFISIFLFISVRQRELEQRTRDFQFKTLHEFTDEVYMIYDPSLNKMEFVTSNVDRILGVNYKAFVTNKLELFSHLNGQAEEMEKAIRYNAVHTKLEQEILYKNPTTRKENWMKLSLYPIEHEKVINRYILSIRDLTKEKENEKILSSALYAAQNASLAKSDFLSRMSHEIRTPMNAISGMTTIALANLDNPPKVKDCLIKTSNSTKHLLMLINDILDMSKIESGKLVVINENFNLPFLINNVSSIVMNQASARKQEFHIFMGNVNHETLNGDALRLNQILLNVLSNAVKYSPEGGRIKLSIDELGECKPGVVKLRFTVADNGLGMSQVFLDKLFTPFEQENRDKGSRPGSTGIGMAITKNLVSLMDGTIVVTSVENQGSTFIIELPFGIVEAIDTTPISPQDFKAIKTLVIDGDKDSCNHLVVVLDNLGVSATFVDSSEQAIEMIVEQHEKGSPYDIAFVDWKMPNISGVELTQIVRKMTGSNILIILISSFDSIEVEQRAQFAGANAFLPKPIYKSAVFNTLALVARSKKTGWTRGHDKIEFSDIRLSDRSTPEVDIESIDFSGKRFLIAEDNFINIEIIEEILTSKNAIVNTVENGRDAVDVFKESPLNYFDAILLDIQMPVMDGYTAARTIRALVREDAKNIPIIAMTADAFKEDIKMTHEAGMNVHIAKPLDVELVYSVIHQQLNPKKLG